MGLLSIFLVIQICLLCIFVKVDSKGNQHHSPNDRPRHNRPHNLHRAPYEGYDWDKNGYKRNLDPIRSHRKDKNKGKDINS